MSSGWVSGGPEWLFGLMLVGAAAAFFAGLAWILLWDNAHAPMSHMPSGRALGLAALLLGIVFVVEAMMGSDDWSQDGPLLIAVAIGGAVYLTARAAARQAGPAGHPVAWTQMVSPWRWSVPAVGLVGFVVAGSSFSAMMLMGHPV